MAAQTTQAQWQVKAQASAPRPSSTAVSRCPVRQTFDNANPANGKVFAKVAATDAPDVDPQEAARRAFDAGKWSRSAPAERKRVLLKLAELIEANTEELALTESLDMGKPIRDAQRIDIPATARCFRWYGEAIDKVYDEIAPTGRDTLAMITREPMGVIGAVVPWNFPLIMASALAGTVTGNSVVLGRPRNRRSRRCVSGALMEGACRPAYGPALGFGETAAALALHKTSLHRALRLDRSAQIIRT
jgi:acyl-CoA reductase-like NAD-dependent aldehyde dehydrogenase